MLKNLDVEAQKGGTIQYAGGWKLIDTLVHTPEGQGVVLKDSKDITGLK